MDFIGRDDECKIISEATASGRAALGIIYGRRRIGKSALLKRFITGPGDYYFEGLEKAPGRTQIRHFTDRLAEQTGSLRVVANNWDDAFKALTAHIAKGRHFVVFDEFPWMAASRTELVALLKYYWDNVWKENSRLTLVLCGSVAGFMVKHVVHSKALHNRKTFEINLGPLSSFEAMRFFGKYRADFEILKFLMVFGGVPKYLEQVDPKKSLTENLDRLCFRKNGFFVHEFETLFKEQFKVFRHYGEIVNVLARESLSQAALATRLKSSPGGSLTGYISNLEAADFVRSFHPYSVTGMGGRTRRVYLWDEWLNFYFTYMQPSLDVIKHNTTPGLFESVARGGFDAYCGRAFERLCLKNIVSVIAPLGVTLHQIKGFGPFFRQGSRGKARRRSGVQIDILMEKTGRTLMLFECKYSANPVGIEVIREVEEKIAALKAPRHYSLEKILIAPGGVTSGLATADYFHRILGMEAVLPKE